MVTAYSEDLMVVKAVIGDRELKSLQNDVEAVEKVRNIVSKYRLDMDVHEAIFDLYHQNRDIDHSTVDGKGFDLSGDVITEYKEKFNLIMIDYVLDDPIVTADNMYETWSELNNGIYKGTTDATIEILHDIYTTLWSRGHIVTVNDMIAIMEELPLYFKVMHFVQHCMG